MRVPSLSQKKISFFRSVDTTDQWSGVIIKQQSHGAMASESHQNQKNQVFQNNRVFQKNQVFRQPTSSGLKQGRSAKSELAFQGLSLEDSKT